MSGDFSRLAFNPQKAYNKVLMQQGKVILDADWNEMQAIQDWKNETMVEDLIGPIAFPIKKPAFNPTILGGLSFSGNTDFVLIEKEEPYFDTNKSFSIEALITVKQSGHSMAIISQWQDAVHVDGECGFCFGVTSQGRLFFLRSIVHESGLEIDELQSTKSLDFDTDHNVAATYNGKVLTLFINGERVGATTEEKSGYYEMAPTIIGASLFGNRPDRCFAGRIADVRIWSRCLRKRELETKIFKSHHLGEIGLQAWWPLNEGRGDIARDISGHGYDGLLGAGVTEHMPQWFEKILHFSAGRMYLGGTIVESFDDITKQAPNFLGQAGYFLTYVEMQQAVINGAQDDEIIEPALGSETTLRQKTLLEIKYFPEKDTLSSVQLLTEAWEAYCEPLSRQGRLKVTPLNNHPLFNNCLYRVQIYKNTDLKNQQTLQVVWSSDNSSLTFKIDDLKFVDHKGCFTVYGLTNTKTVIKPGCYISLIDANGIKLQQNGKLLKVTDVDYEHELIDFTGDIKKPSGTIVMQVWHTDICEVDNDNTGEFQLNIDNRLKLLFEPDCYYDEDSYWLIPARSTSNSLLWPIDCYQQMTGTARQVALLAEYQFFGETCWLRQDKRPYFHSVSAGENFIRKSGGTFTGSVTIEGDLTLNGRLSDNSIDTEQLKDNAVDIHKLQGNVGLHLGQCLLSQCSTPPSGFSKVGKLIGDTENSLWTEMPDLLPFGEPFTALNVAERVFLLYGNGAVFEILQNPQTSQLELIEKNHRPGEAIRRFATCAHNNYIYVAGGETSNGEKSDDFYCYSLTEDYWEKLCKLKHPTSHLSLCASGNTVYAMGGLHNAFLGLLQHAPSHKNERYDLQEDTWHVMANIPDYRYSASAVEYQGKIHLIGGSDRELSGLLSESFQSTHFVYDPQIDQWLEKAEIPLARSRFGAVVHNDKIYCLGGKIGDDYTGNVQVYNIETDYWRSEASLNFPRSHAAAVILGGHLVALGGKTILGYLSVIEEQVLSTDFFVHRLDHYL